MCQNGFAAALTAEQNLAHIKLDCHCWNCQQCAEKIKNAWKLDIQTHLDDEPILFKGYVQPHEWNKRQKALRRAKAKWLKVDNQDGRFLVIATQNPGFLNKTSRGKALVTVKQAVNALRKPKNTKHFRPITTCRQWKRKQKLGIYRFVAWITKKRFHEAMKGLAESIRKKVHNGVEFTLCKVLPTLMDSAINAIQCPYKSIAQDISSHRELRTTRQGHDTKPAHDSPQRPTHQAPIPLLSG